MQAEAKDVFSMTGERLQFCSKSFLNRSRGLLREAHELHVPIAHAIKFSK
jgi:hypothetical protein